MQNDKAKTRQRLDSFEEAIVEIIPLAEDLDIAGQAVENRAQARENLAAVRRVVADMSSVIDRAEAALA